jgi:hypothetical protein
MAQPDTGSDRLVVLHAQWSAAWQRLEDWYRQASVAERKVEQATPAKLSSAVRQKRAIDRAVDRADAKVVDLGTEMFRLRAQSLSGVAAKLDVAIRFYAPSPDCAEAPWPWLRSIQRDLDKLR